VTPPPPPALGRRLQVQSREFYFSLSRPEVASGDVSVELLNRGEDPHDLRLRPPGGGEEVGLPETPPFGVSSGVFPLAAGEWTLCCSLEGHESLGMSATLHVR